MEFAQVTWRVIAIAVAYAIVDRLLGLLNGPRPSLSPSYLGTVAISLVAGAAFALILLPLARRLPCRMALRFVCIFAPLYWIGLLSNLIEAVVNTTLSVGTLIAGAVFLAIPYAVAALMITWLLPAQRQEGPPLHIRSVLAQRSLGSWAWRILLAAVLFAGLLELLGILWGPLIAKYYQNPTFISQVHTVIRPAYIVGPEEVIRGIVFVLVLLPVLAVMPGRSPKALSRTAAYIALINAVLESWVPMLSMATYPLGFRIGEGLDLTSDAVVRGIFIALLLALPIPRATVALMPDASSSAVH